MDGILPVYKQAGMSSYDVIRVFKRSNKPSYKVGHGGTLDPFAEGVLLLLLGSATKVMNTLTALPKTYQAKAILGAKSDTLDVTGKIQDCDSNAVTLDKVKAAAASFVGQYEQVIPAYSAAKVNGRARYLLAREGVTVEQKTKIVEIHEVDILQLKGKEVIFVATVGSGTYIRQLSFDIFHKIDVCSYLTSLVRTQIGDFDLQKCVSIMDLENGVWRGKVVRL